MDLHHLELIERHPSHSGLSPHSRFRRGLVHILLRAFVDVSVGDGHFAIDCRQLLHHLGRSLEGAPALVDPVRLACLLADEPCQEGDPPGDCSYLLHNGNVSVTVGLDTHEPVFRMPFMPPLRVANKGIVSGRYGFWPDRSPRLPRICLFFTGPIDMPPVYRQSPVFAPQEIYAVRRQANAVAQELSHLASHAAVLRSSEELSW